MPIVFAAWWARTMPAKLFLSVIAIAAWPSAAAVTTSSSGCEAPRRNEKLLATCNSAYPEIGSGPMPRLLGIFLAGLSPCGRRLPSPIRRDSRSKLAMSPERFGGSSGIGGSSHQAKMPCTNQRGGGGASPMKRTRNQKGFCVARNERPLLPPPAPPDQVRGRHLPRRAGEEPLFGLPCKDDFCAKRPGAERASKRRPSFH